MITRIQARNYKCLKDVDIGLSPFQVLVGPNGSGKSTLMDVLGFIRDMLWERDGLNAAVEKRARSFDELTWNGEGGEIEFAVELDLPGDADDAKTWRYELTVARDEDAGGLAIVHERAEVERMAGPGNEGSAAGASGTSRTAPRADEHGRAVILDRSEDRGAFMFDMKGFPRGGMHVPGHRSFMADAAYYAARAPETKQVFGWVLAAHTALAMHEGVLAVDTAAMRRPCRPDVPKTLVSDGSNIAKVVASLKERDPKSYKEWLGHLRTVLEDLTDISVVEQEHDRHLYIRMVHEGGPPVSAWLMSDGALRFLGLTLLAYMPDNDRIFLVEEPENGMHPLAIQSVFDSLRSVYDGQVFLATHSPLVVGCAELDQLLCFSRGEDAGTRVIRGEEHRAMRNWKKSVGLGGLYASGIFDDAD